MLFGNSKALLFIKIIRLIRSYQMSVFKQIKENIVTNKYATQDIVDHWIEPKIDDLHSFLLDENLAAEQIASVFSNIANLNIYNGDAPTTDQDWFVEGKTLWMVNPWSSYISDIVLSQQTLGFDINTIGVFQSSEHTVDVKEDKAWEAAPDGVIDKVKSLVMQAYDANASDIHIAPRTDEIASVKFRVLGATRHIFDLLIDDDYFALANTFLQLSGKHAGIYNAPIDGKFIVYERNLKINIRLAMMPVLIAGEIVPKFVLRVHGNAIARALSALHFLERQIVLLSESAKYSDGLILNTGPMGSGKTTTLYALLNIINSVRKGVSIQTLEDPIEANIYNVDQTEINNQAGMSYSSGLRTMLRSDANVMLVGEIRDTETANLTVEAAMTGHLVLSTLHARTAMGAIRRMLKLGVSTLDLADTLALAVAQRMVKRVCPTCSNKILFGSLKKDNIRSYNRYKDLLDDDVIMRANPKGCPKCAGFGYLDRALVAEVALIDEEIADMIVREVTMAQLNQRQKEKGFLDLWAHGIELIKSEITTLEELESSLPRRNLGYE